MMNCDTTIAEPVTEKRESTIQFPTGLLGFENVKNYVLLADPEEAPFAWLQMGREPNLSFLVVSPMYVCADYNPDVSEEDIELLGVTNGDDVLVFNIVTLHKDGSATVNMKGPIMINRQTLVAKQVVPANAADYSIQHPLNVQQA